MSERAPHPPAQAGAPAILFVDNLTVRLNGFRALNCLTLSVMRGELRVVIGPNGAGKTTLLDVITGKVRPTSGRVVFQPSDQPARVISSMPEEQIVRLGVGRKFQTPNIFKSLTVRENLRLSLKTARGVFASLTSP